MILCQYYEVNYEEFNKLLKKREKSYLTVLLMKKFRCLNSEESDLLGSKSGNKGILITSGIILTLVIAGGVAGYYFYKINYNIKCNTN